MFGSYLTFTEYGYPHPSGPAYDLVFQQAPDLSRILGFDEIQVRGVKGKEPMDVSHGLNCIRIYSNLVKQMISFETSPLVDCMIYSTMGLNNVCSFVIQYVLCSIQLAVLQTNTLGTILDFSNNLSFILVRSYVFCKRISILIIINSFNHT